MPIRTEQHRTRYSRWPFLALAVGLLIPPALLVPSFLSGQFGIRIPVGEWTLEMGRVDYPDGLLLRELPLNDGHYWSCAIPGRWKYSVYFGPPIPNVQF